MVFRARLVPIYKGPLEFHRNRSIDTGTPMPGTAEPMRISIPSSHLCCSEDKPGKVFPWGLAPNFLQPECPCAAASNGPQRDGTGQMVTVMFKP